MVVVTLNYRLGAFGFLSHAALDATRGNEPSGNDGLRDQQLALKWVKNNIAAFAGDPSKVTVAGESAGAMSACIHLVSLPARKLVQRFVFESGVCTGETLLKKNRFAEAQRGDRGPIASADPAERARRVRTTTDA
jgi:para-nitrobenzyl esterase